MSIRRIARIARSRPTIESAGVRLKRAFGYDHVPQFDPFLMLDDFHSSNPDDYLPGFPWHPHRGIETITYVLEGEVAHGDSMGNSGVIGAGEVQWMTAGSGIIHQEMPRESPTGTMWGFQFWANLPASHKMMQPRYREVKAADIPVVDRDDGSRIRVVAGEIDGISGPVHDIVIDPAMFDIHVPPAATFSLDVPSDHTIFVYVIAGAGYFDDRRELFSCETVGDGWSDVEPQSLCELETVILYGPEGDTVQVSTTDQPVRFLLVSGKPLDEPVAWYGPIVMNTREELRQAFEEYHNGTFIKADAPGVEPQKR